MLFHKEPKLQALFSSVQNLESVGEKTYENLSRINCTRIIDLVWHFPINLIIKQINPDLSYVESGTYIITEVTIDHFDQLNKFARKNTPFKLYVYNNTGYIELVFFNYHPTYLIKNLHEGAKIVVSGKIERFGNKLQISHPEFTHSLISNSAEYIYNLTYGITSKQIRKLVQQALFKVPNFTEWIEEETINANQWPTFKEAITELHNPKNSEDFFPRTKPRMRLTYDEFLANQLSLGLIRIYKNKIKGNAITVPGKLKEQLLNQLEFELTSGQKEIIKEIVADQESEYRMMRLLQGDVGSGKTVVALIAALNIVEAGKQACIMAPTDILASQHYQWMQKACQNLPVRTALLTGRIKGKKREILLKNLLEGDIDILIGTHATFQEKVEFKDLGFIVIDEQHRFGVEQRIALAQKGNNPDILVMSATPIPRTLTLTLSGDMDISRLVDKPKGRIPIITSLVSKNHMDELVNSLRNLINDKGKAYWICPLIEEQEKESSNFKKHLAAAIARYQEFEAIFPGKVGLIHGKMKGDEKDKVMMKFATGEVQLLIATTVIEVGIDVKDATVIIIEQAEKFGLSQLHQLRGRVGRGDKQSYCILLYDTPISASSRARLKIMKETEDGFLIAEEDLKIRGAGEILGIKQSGLAKFKIGDLEHHQDLLIQASNTARNILENDPQLLSEKGRNLRELLKIFEYNNQIDYLSG
ncbi:MAG: ATP-dependent DNA helicase RecG [Alphaproteobacteria bacterium]